MINFIKQEVIIEESLKKKLELICEFSNKTKFGLNGAIKVGNLPSQLTFG